MSGMYNSHEVFEIGITIEKNGRAFYGAAAGGAKDPDMRKFFEELARWEDSHVKLFEELKARLPDEKLSPDTDAENQYHAYLRSTAGSHVFRGDTDPAKMAAGRNGPLDVLRIALQFEKDSVVLYVSMKALVPAHLGKKTIDTLIEEEMKHVQMIGAQIERLE
jgi:rubrerythrin